MVDRTGEFHNAPVAGKAWRQSRKGVCVLLVAGALAFSMGGCGGNASPSASSAHDTTRGTAPTSARTGPGISAPAIAPAVFTGPAVDTFGQAQVDAAYRELADFDAQFTYQAKLLPESGWTAEDFEAPTAFMTATAASGYRQTVQKAIAGDSNAQDSLEGVSYFGIATNGSSFATTGPLVVNRTIGDATATVDTTGTGKRLQMSFADHGDLRVTYKGAASLVPMDKTVTYTLVPAPANTGHAWLIDAIANHWNVSTPIPDTGTY